VIGAELVECREQDRIALGDALVREPLQHHRRAIRRRREPRPIVGHAGLGRSTQAEAQLAQPCAVHVAGGCSNTIVIFSNPSEHPGPRRGRVVTAFQPAPKQTRRG
jgi:hypothetical protein